MGVSCSDILDTDSELVEFEKDNTLNHPTDSVYSILGIVNKMQIIADRTVLLGEVRADLVNPTDAASSDLKRLSAFSLAEPNKYNNISDYYAVINNCNYYLANVDTALQRRGRQLFKYEYAAVKAFRAWTYLELVKNYGQVPLVTVPVMSEREAAATMQGPKASIKEVCDYFISDLTPYALTDLPDYNVGGWDFDLFFIPMRPLLGDLCLWAGRYEEAARWYNSYLNDPEEPVLLNNRNVTWTSPTVFSSPRDAYSVTSDIISYIPMEARIFDGNVSDLQNIFCSTRQNNYYFQLEPSRGMRNLSASQTYCMEYKTETTTDTVYVPHTGMSDELFVGDLRLYSNYRLTSMGGQDEYSEYNSAYQTIYKVVSSYVSTYRATMVYLRYAEALCRAGLPQSALCVLKYGMCPDYISLYVDSIEQAEAGDLIAFNQTTFTRERVSGIHSRGCGDSQCDTLYALPQPATELATRRDTVLYQMPLVEDMIVNEMALEGSFEGYRFYDLMRVALRRGDPAYLADPVSRRNGEADESLRQLLMNQQNWYLPIQ
ncbi:MAG: RagB/SusD family nutrient uptake outer membrane protein [Prevotella sp.]|nr:RagB/SusD family nutrient uptake outer membrane protein [Prevotella sp.]